MLTYGNKRNICFEGNKADLLYLPAFLALPFRCSPSISGDFLAILWRIDALSLNFPTKYTHLC